MPKKLKVPKKNMFVGVVCERVDKDVICSFCHESKPCARSPHPIKYKKTHRDYEGVAYLKRDTTIGMLFGPRTVDKGAKEHDVYRYEDIDRQEEVDICKDCAAQIARQL